MENELLQPNSPVVETDNSVTLSDFLNADAPTVKDNPSLVGLNDFMGTPSEEIKPAITPIPEEHRSDVINKLGDSIYNGMLNFGLRFGGGVLNGVANLNDFLGLDQLAEEGRGYAKQAFDASAPENTPDRIFSGFVSSLGSMSITVPVDIMTGKATKIALAGRVLPKVAEILGMIPDFALGAGWRGLVEGVENGEGVIDSTVKGITQAGENIAINTLYASAGLGFKGIGKMAAYGAASAFYDAAKEGRAPTSQEVIDGTAQGAAMGAFFTMLPMMAEATKISKERRVIKEYERQVNNFLKSEKGSVGVDPAELPKIVDKFMADERIRPEIRKSLAEPFLDVLERRGELVVPELKLGQWKDSNMLSTRLNTVERNIEKVAKGSDVQAVKDFTTEKVKENETMKNRWLTQSRFNLEGMVKSWGIKPNSTQDKLIQRYGEKTITLEELKAQAPKEWEKIDTSAKWFRQQYDTLLDEINTVRKRYGYEPIAKRVDYFRHFRDLTGVNEIYGFMATGRPAETATAGILNKTKSGKPFNPTELARKGGPYTESAIGGYSNYIKVAANQLFHTDSVQRMRMLENYVRVQAEAGEAVDLSNFVSNLNDYATVLSGQSLQLDRSVANFFGPRAWRWFRWLQRQTASNMVGYNFKTAIYNTIPLLTQAPATMGKCYWLKGLYTSTLTPFNKNGFLIDGIESDFFTRRYPKKEMALDFWAKGRDAGQAVAMAIDQFSVKAILAGKYFELKAAGVKPQEAMKKAGDYTARMVADRSMGQKPVIMESSALQPLTLFQTETNNLVSWLTHDLPKESHGSVKKLVGALSQYAVYSWVFNNISEELTGTRPVIDPLYALITLVGANKSGVGRETGDRVKVAAQNLIGQLPFGNLIGEGNRGRYPVAAGIPDLWNAGEHPVKEISKPFTYWFTPFGGGQVKKTIEGLTDYYRGSSLTPSGEERYGVNQDIANFFRASMFGKNAFPEAVEYWSLPPEER